jgi:hypothetical protein
VKNLRVKKKAFSYLRVSGKSQINGDGFPRQAETIARYAKAVQEFRDKASAALRRWRTRWTGQG